MYRRTNWQSLGTFRLSVNTAWKSTFTFSRHESVMSAPFPTPFSPVCIPASAGPQFTSSVCLIYTTTDADTIRPVWCCYLDLTV